MKEKEDNKNARQPTLQRWGEVKPKHKVKNTESALRAKVFQENKKVLNLCLQYKKRSASS